MLRWVLAIAVMAGSGVSAQADITVFADFGANWVTNLNTLTSGTSIDAFSAGERASIEASILSRLSDAYSNYNATFQTTAGGATDTLNFGAVSGSPGALGVAPLDFGNLGGDTVSIFSHNFGFIVDEFVGSTNRATQIDQLSAALAGTAAHELGHSLGQLHHHAYSADGITEANYSNTTGLQNQHIMATGSTGLGEIGRETDRTFAPFSDLVLESAGGFDTGLFGSSNALVDSPLLQTTTDFDSDVGSTTGTATALALTSMPISGMDAANTLGRLTNDADVDVFSFDVTAPGLLSAQIYSTLRWADAFDPRIRLFDVDGSTVLADNNDLAYSGNTFGAGGFGTVDSSLINVGLTAPGTYFLEVSSVGNTTGASGGLYSLLFGADTTAVPEPSTHLAMLLGLVGFIAYRRRRSAVAVTAC
jgi:hypothetical protein